MNEKLKKAKKVIKNNWKPFTVGVVFTGVTFIVTKRVTTRYWNLQGTIVINKAMANEGPLYKVFNIYAPGFKYQGPSWMITCKETGKAFRSQKHAAKVMKLSRQHIGDHLNGNRSNVKGYHFERIGIGV